MKLAEPININYAATVVRINRLIELNGLDNLVGVSVLGYQALTTKGGFEVGDLAVAFTAETQLTGTMAANNDLYRHAELNVHKDKVGYLEDNGRIKAIRLRGHVSNALVLPLGSLAWTGFDLSTLQEGDTFDSLGDWQICRKYQGRMATRGAVATVVKESRVDERVFPKHFDTPNFFRMADEFAAFPDVIVTQKLHGTSMRMGHIRVPRKLNRSERAIKWFQRKLGWLKDVKIQEQEYAYVYGSRNVVKDPGSHEDGFYGNDIYTQVGKRYLLPRDYVVYGEIVGWASWDKPIQPGYTYGFDRGEAELFVYRVVHINADGLPVDLPWKQVVAFCQQNDMMHVPVLTYEQFPDPELVKEDWLDWRFVDSFPNALPVDKGQVDEGVVLRVDAFDFKPLVAKAKSPKFLEFETKQLDRGESTEEELVYEEPAKYVAGMATLPVVDELRPGQALYAQIHTDDDGVTTVREDWKLMGYVDPKEMIQS